MTPTRAAASFVRRWTSRIPVSSGTPPWMYIAGGAICAAAAIALVGSGPTSALLVVAGACALALVTSPFVALCAVVSLISLEALNTIQPSPVYSFTGIKMFGLVLVLSLVPDLLFKRIRLTFNTGVVVLGFFFLGIVGSLVNTSDMRSAVSGILTFAQLAVLWFAVQHLVGSRDQLRIVAKVAVFTLFISAMLALVQFIGDPKARVSGTSQNAAILSADLFVALGFGFALWTTTLKKSSQWIWMIALGIVGLGVLVTLSRAAYVAFFPAVLIGALYMGKGGRGIAVAFGLVIAVFLLAPFAVQRMEETSVRSDPSTRGHLHSIDAGIQMMKDHPLFGVGVDNYHDYYLQYTNDRRGQPRSAHNSYLAIGAEMGVPALLAFILLHLYAFRSLWLRRKDFREAEDIVGLIWTGSLAFCLTGFALIGLFHSLEISKYLWILLALSAQPPPGSGKVTWT